MGGDIPGGDFLGGSFPDTALVLLERKGSICENQIN